MTKKSGAVVFENGHTSFYEHYLHPRWVARLNPLDNFMLLKAPPLVVSARELQEFVAAIREVLELADTSLAFWTEANARSIFDTQVTVAALTRH
jgi:hypothetical protein